MKRRSLFVGAGATIVAIAAAPSLLGARADAHHTQRIHPSYFPLSPRELELAWLVALGLTDKDIARRMVLSTHTVKAHVQTIIRKLDLDRRNDLRRWLARHAGGYRPTSA